MWKFWLTDWDKGIRVGTSLGLISVKISLLGFNFMIGYGLGFMDWNVRIFESEWVFEAEVQSGEIFIPFETNHGNSYETFLCDFIDGHFVQGFLCLWFCCRQSFAYFLLLFFSSFCVMLASGLSLRSSNNMARSWLYDCHWALSWGMSFKNLDYRVFLIILTQVLFGLPLTTQWMLSHWQCKHPPLSIPESWPSFSSIPSFLHLITPKFFSIYTFLLYLS